MWCLFPCDLSQSHLSLHITALCILNTFPGKYLTRKHSWVTEPLLLRGSDLLTRRWVALVLWGKGPGVAMPSLLRARPSLYGEPRSSRPPFQHPECAPRRPGAWSSRHRGRRWRSGGHEGQAVLTDESRVPSGGAAWAPPGAGATWWKA